MLKMAEHRGRMTSEIGQERTFSQEETGTKATFGTEIRRLLRQ